MAHAPTGRRRVPLREVAHARAGDKGNISSVAVFAYEPRHYPALKAQLTPERLKAEFGGVLRGAVTRYELDGLHGLNFVMREGLEGGVDRRRVKGTRRALRVHREGADALDLVAEELDALRQSVVGAADFDRAPLVDPA